MQQDIVQGDFVEAKSEDVKYFLKRSKAFVVDVAALKGNPFDDHGQQKASEEQPCVAIQCYLNPNRFADKVPKLFRPPKLPNGYCVWVRAKDVKKVVLDTRYKDFPLESLPLPVLAVVLRTIPIREAAMIALVSKRFHAAFNDDPSWQRRAHDLLGVQEAEKFAEEAKKASWKEIYAKKCLWEVEVVTVFTHRGGTTVSGRFSVRVSPEMHVGDFLNLVKNDPKNDQKRRGVAELEPFDPSVLRRRNGGQTESINPDGKPNCEFRADDEKATLRDAGLCNGAVLSQYEMLRRD